MNRRILLASLPTDRLAVTDFELVEAERPEPGPGEVQVRTLAITIGAGQRAGLQGSASYAGAPVTGVVMGGTGVGRVTASDVPDLPVGCLVTGPLGWQEWSVHRPEVLTRCTERPGVPGDGHGGDPALHLGLLGTNGLTAYFGLFDVGRPQPGETVLVSAAAGSVGHLVGQLARLHGCRVVGIAGSAEKCALLVDRLGFDAAVDHRSPTFRADLTAATPDGVDVYFDNVGGDVLGAALRRMNRHGRIVCCGVVSQYDTTSPQPGPRGIPGLLVNQRIRMEGFLVFDFADRYDEARTRLRAWHDEGRLVALQDEIDGLEHAPAAFVDLLAGGNVGTRIVRVGQDG